MQNSIGLNSDDKMKVYFLRVNFGLRQIYIKPLESGMKSCGIRLERIDLEDHIPLSKLSKYLIFKGGFS